MRLKLELKYTEKPKEIEFTPERTAFLIIDMQNDFCDEGGLADKIGVDIPRMRKPIEPIRRAADAARRSGIKVINIGIALRPDLSDVSKVYLEQHSRTHVPIGAKIGPDGENLGVLIKGTWNSNFIEELQPQPGDVVIEKKSYGGFQDTDLELILRNFRVDTLIFTGIATHMCVESTLREAFMRGFRVVLLKDCVTTFDDELQRVSERIIEFWFGYIAKSDNFIKSLTVA